MGVQFPPWSRFGAARSSVLLHEMAETWDVQESLWAVSPLAPRGEGVVDPTGAADGDAPNVFSLAEAAMDLLAELAALPVDCDGSQVGTGDREVVDWFPADPTVSSGNHRRLIQM